MPRRKARPPNSAIGVAQFEVFSTFGKWMWWVRATDGTIIAKALRALPRRQTVWPTAGNAAPVVFLNEGKSK
jgi:hypothetical protein